MSEIIFIDHFAEGKIRDSYWDLYNMVDLWGYKRCSMNEVDYQSDATYICTFKDGAADSSFSSKEAKARKCKIVLWQLEWPEWEDGKLQFPEHAGEKYNIMGEWLWADEIWVSDKYVIDLMEKFNPAQSHRFRYVFLGGHPDFGAQGYDDREFFWRGVYIAYLAGMRMHKYELLRTINGNTFWAPNGWGKERHHALIHTRWGINLHQGEMPVITPQRFMIFASYSLPILTEYCADPSPYIVFQDGLNHFQPHKTAVGNKMLRDGAIAHNYELVTHWKTFKSEVDAAVSAMLYHLAAHASLLRSTETTPSKFNEMARDVLGMSPDDQAMAKMQEERFGMFGSPEVGKV